MAAEGKSEGDLLDQCHQQVGCLSFEVLKINRYQIKQARIITFEVGENYEADQLVVSTGSGDKREEVRLDSIDFVHWDTNDDSVLKIEHRGKMTGGKMDTSHTTFIFFFRSFVEREMCGHCLQMLNPSIKCGSDSEMWMDDTVVRFRAESMNSVGVKTEIVLDIDCELGNLLLNDGEVGVPVSDVMIQPHLGNPRRLDLSWGDESEQRRNRSTTWGSSISMKGARGTAVKAANKGSSTLKSAISFSAKKAENAEAIKERSRSMSVASQGTGAGRSIDAAEDDITNERRSSALSISASLSMSPIANALGQGMAGLFVMSNRLVIQFRSATSRERFQGRLRALQMGIDVLNGENSKSVPLPTGEMLHIFTGTWNVGDKPPPDNLDDLSLWIPRGEFDIYAIGFQENSQKRKWIKAITAHLNHDEAKSVASTRCNGMEVEFDNFGVTSLWDIHVMLFMRRDIKSRVKVRSHCTEATGVAHVLGNKGTAALSFILDSETSFCFCTSHLAAQAKPKRMLKRQENYEESVQGMTLDGGYKNIEFMHQFDHVFWFGDFNYRVDLGNHGTSEEFHGVLKHIEAQRLDILLPCDQLAKQMQMQRVFVGFNEGSINFNPTYRLVKGKREYSNKKHQNPSYCDRVVWKSAAGFEGKVIQTMYNGIFDLLNSDHRPVCAGFDVFSRVPYVMRNGRLGIGAMCLIALSDVTFLVAPDSSDPKQTHYSTDLNYDGFKGSLVLHTQAPFINDTCSAPVPCETPQHAKTLKSDKGCDSGNLDQIIKTMRAGEVPMWQWKANHIGILRSTTPDPEWVGAQRLVAKICRGSSEDGTLMGQAEIPLDCALRAIAEGMGEEDDMLDEYGEDDEAFDEDDHGHATGTAETIPPWKVATKKPADEEEGVHEYIRDLNDPEQKGGAFSVPVVLHGNWVGMLMGRVEMLEFEGPSPDGSSSDLSRQLSELEKWKALLEFARGSEEVKRNMGATTIQQNAATVVVTQKEERSEVTAVTLSAPTDMSETPDQTKAPQEQKEAAAVIEDDDDVAKPVKIYNFNAKALKAPVASGGIGGAEEGEDEEEDEEEDDEVAEAAMEVYLQHGEVIFKDGRKMPENEFVCSVTGESLLDQDFVIHNGKPFSRKAYLDQFADHVDGSTLQPLYKGDNVVLAMGYKWKIENFRCAGTGKPLNFEQFMVKGGKPYSVEAYVEKFRVCPTCNETVALGDDSAIEWMGMIFHADHFQCAGTGCVLKQGDKVYAKDLGDGMGPRPYCEKAYAEQFCPVCPGCSEYVLPDEESVNACGSVWHKEHFRCAATGVQLDTDYHEHDGLPYSEKAFYDLFGISCSTCGEVIKNDALSVLGQSWHPECFICQSSGLPISQDAEGNFIDWFEEAHMVYNKHEFGKLFGSRCHYCEELVVEDIRVTTPEINGIVVERSYHPECLRCIETKAVLDPDEDDILFGTDDGLPYSSDAYFAKYGKDFIDGHVFDETEEFYVIDGLPLRMENYMDLMVDSWCAGCGKPINGPCKITPKLGSFKWHPECLDAYLDENNKDKKNPYEVVKGITTRVDGIKEVYKTKREEYAVQHATKFKEMQLLCKNEREEARKTLLGKRTSAFSLQRKSSLAKIGASSLLSPKSLDAPDAATQPLSSQLGALEALAERTTSTDGSQRTTSNASQRPPEAKGAGNHAADMEGDTAPAGSAKEEPLAATSTAKADLATDASDAKVEETPPTPTVEPSPPPPPAVAPPPNMDATKAEGGTAAEKEKEKEKGDGDGVPKEAGKGIGGDEAKQLAEAGQGSAEEKADGGRSSGGEAEPPKLKSHSKSVHWPEDEEVAEVLGEANLREAASKSVHFQEIEQESQRLSQEGTSKHGHMFKKGGGTTLFGRSAFQRRFFVLEEGRLKYYHNAQEVAAGKPPLKNAIYTLRHCQVEAEGGLQLNIVPMKPAGGPRTLECKCDSEAELGEWMTVLRAATKAP